MDPGMPCTIRRVVFLFMVVIGLWNFFLNIAARYKEHPFDNINGFPLFVLNIITSTVWVGCTVLYIGITWHYGKEHPYWSVGSLVLALSMSGFMVWAGLDLFDWFVWGPLIVDLSIIVRAGLEAVATSDQSGMLRQTINGFWGFESLPQRQPQSQSQDQQHGLGPDLEGAHELAHVAPRPHNG